MKKIVALILLLIPILVIGQNANYRKVTLDTLSGRYGRIDIKDTVIFNDRSDTLWAIRLSGDTLFINNDTAFVSNVIITPSGTTYWDLNGYYLYNKDGRVYITTSLQIDSLRGTGTRYLVVNDSGLVSDRAITYGYLLAGGGLANHEGVFLDDSTMTYGIIYDNMIDSASVMGHLNVDSNFYLQTIEPTTYYERVLVWDGVGKRIYYRALESSSYDTTINLLDSCLYSYNGSNIIYPRDTTWYVGIGKPTATYELDIDGRIGLPQTTSTKGILYFNELPYFHIYDDPSDSTFNLFLGKYAGNFTLNGSSMANSSHNIGIGGYALNKLTTGYMNTAIGSRAGSYISTGYYNTAVGTHSANKLSTGWGNVAIGTYALAAATTTNFNTAIGYNSGFAITGSGSTILGYRAGYGLTTGDYNTILGGNSFTATSTGTNNIGIGYQVGQYATGSYNVFIGNQSGSNNTGSNNIFIGYSSGYNETGSNKLYIDPSNTTTPLIQGDFAKDSIRVNGALDVMDALYVGDSIFSKSDMLLIPTGNVGILTTTPDKELDVNGEIKVRKIKDYVDDVYATQSGIVRWKKADSVLYVEEGTLFKRNKYVIDTTTVKNLGSSACLFSAPSDSMYYKVYNVDMKIIPVRTLEVGSQTLDIFYTGTGTVIGSFQNSQVETASTKIYSWTVNDGYEISPADWVGIKFSSDANPSSGSAAIELYVTYQLVDMDMEVTTRPSCP